MFNNLFLIFIFIYFYPLQEVNASILEDENDLYFIQFKDYKDNLIDTNLNLQYLEENVEDFSGFNYPEFTPETTKNSIILTFKDISIIIKKEVFDTSEVELTYNQEYQYLNKINGKTFYGTDGNIPRYRISKIEFAGDTNFVLPSEHYDDLFEPNLKCNSGNDCYIKAYIADNKEIILTMRNSDAAGAYITIFIFDNKFKLKMRIVKGLC